MTDSDLHQQHNHLSNRVTGIESTMGGIKDQINGLATQMSTLVDRLSSSSKTDWNVLFAAAGVMITIIGSFVLIEKQPLENSIAYLDRKLIELKSESVSRAEEEGDRKVLEWRVHELEYRLRLNDRVRQYDLDAPDPVPHK